MKKIKADMDLGNLENLEMDLEESDYGYPKDKEVDAGILDPFDFNFPIGGKFKCSKEQMIKLLRKHLALEYGSWKQYKLCAGICLGTHPGVVEEFQEHAEDEEEHIDIINRKIVGLGGIPTDISDPVTNKIPCDLKSILYDTYAAEIKAILSLNTILKYCGDNKALENDIQTIVSDEAEHAEDLRKLVRKCLC